MTARHQRIRGINDPGPAWAALSYAVLGFWAFVVLFPLYWLAVTSVKLPIQVNDGPDYLPGIDFEPSLHAWRYIFVDLFVDTDLQLHLQHLHCSHHPNRRTHGLTPARDHRT